MITGLLDIESTANTRTWFASEERRRRPRRLAALLAAAALTTSGGAAVLAQDAEGPVEVPEGELVAQLVELEQDLAGLPLLPDVDVSEDTTWGTITGDLIGTQIILEEHDEELQALVGAASDAPDTPVGDAVEEVAAAYRTMNEGYAFLAAWEQAAIGVVPAPEEAEEDRPAIATGVEDPRGQAEVGLALLVDALAGFSEGYEILRDAEAAAEDRTLFENRYAEVQAVAQSEALEVKLLLSHPVTELLVAVRRFEPTVDGDDPARNVAYTCVDRDDYLTIRSQGNVPDLPVPEGDVPDLPIPDCPNLDNGNEVRPIAPPVS